MYSYRRYNELSQSPFILMLSKCAEDEFGASLYTVGDFSLAYVTERPLPKTAELKGTLSQSEMLSLCKQKNFRHTVRDNGVYISFDDKSFIYSPLHGGSIEADAARRDFTMHSIYISCADGEAHDPLGALSDINDGRLRTCSDAFTSFTEHPARILGMVRLCAEYDLIPVEGMQEAAKKAAPGLADISQDLIRNTLYSVLMCDTAKAYEDRELTVENSPVLRALYMLRDTDCFAYVIPELEKTRDVEQKRRYHKYDVLGHMIHTCAATPPKLHMRMAGLLHDIGKPEAQKKNDGRNMHGHDKIGAMTASTILHRMRCREEFINRVCHIIAIHMYDVAGIAKDATLRKRFALWGYRLTEDLIDFRFADVAGSGCAEKKSDSAVRFRAVFEQMKAENAPFSIYELRISGKDIASILDLNSGAEINGIKRELLRICAVDPQLNERSTLLQLTEQMKNGDFGEE